MAHNEPIIRNGTAYQSLGDVPWELRTELEQAQCLYSDGHKAAYNFRPTHHIPPEQWNSLDWHKNQMAQFQEAIERNQSQEEADQKICVAEFEERISEQLLNGASDRKAAIIAIASTVDMTEDDILIDPDFLCFRMGLPYGYIKDFALH